MRAAAFLLALAGFLAVQAEVEEEGNVLVVTGENFKEVVEGNQYVLMEFCKLHVLMLAI